MMQYSAAKPRQKPYEESVSHVFSLFFQLLQFIQIKIGFHSQVAPLISYKVVLQFRQVTSRLKDGSLFKMVRPRHCQEDLSLQGMLRGGLRGQSR